MILQGDDPGGGSFFSIVIDEFHRLDAVEVVLQVVAVGDDAVISPLAVLRVLGPCQSLAQAASAALLVERAPVAGAHVRLVAADDPFLLIDDLGTVLNAAVGEAR